MSEPTSIIDHQREEYIAAERYAPASCPLDCRCYSCSKDEAYQ